MSHRRIFAIVPAAGHSQRMRQPKLLLPWNGSTIMECVLRAWCDSDVNQVIVVLRKDDVHLLSICEKWPVDVIRPDHDPHDMKASIQFGLRHIAEVHRPTTRDQWMVAPADLPQLNAQLINQLVAAASSPTCVTAPRFGRHQGHPVLLPWALSAEVFNLGENEGLNRILDEQEIVYVDFPADRRVTDVDTPEEYGRLKGSSAGLGH